MFNFSYIEDDDDFMFYNGFSSIREKTKTLATSEVIENLWERWNTEKAGWIARNPDVSISRLSTICMFDTPWGNISLDFSMVRDEFTECCKRLAEKFVVTKEEGVLLSCTSQSTIISEYINTSTFSIYKWESV